MRRRLLTIGHSYCVDVNRRLADELSRTGDWDVTVVAPTRFRGDFGIHVTVSERQEGFRLEAVPVHLASKVHTMLYGRRLRSLLQEPWDLVHCWEEPYVTSAAQVAAWTPRHVPLVLATFQNIDKRYPAPFRWFERYTMHRANGLVAFGRTVLDVAQAHGFPRDRARVIPPGVDTRRFSPDAEARERLRASLAWQDDVPVIGFVGRFVPEKGLTLLTGVLGRLRQPWRALFVGSGPLESDLRRWAEPFGQRVKMATHVAHHEVPDFLNVMDVLCAPSQTTPRWREQFGRMLIEGFAAGVPIVAADSGEMPHVVGDAGVIAPEADASAWERILTAILADPAWRRTLSERGRARAVSHYDWSVVARQHADFFEELAA